MNDGATNIMNQQQNKKPRDHWQEEKDRLIAELEKKILGRREQITIGEIAAAPLPELVLAAFRNHGRGIVRRERPLVLQSSHRFMLDDEEIKTSLRRLREQLVDRLVLPRDEVIEVIVFAVCLQFDVITKPRAALVDLLYEKALERDRDDVKTIIAGLGEQRPMICALLDLISGYPPGAVNREAFIALCRHGERTAYGDKPVSALMADLHDFIDFCGAIDGKPITQVDNQTVLGILFERNLKELAEGLLPALSQKDRWMPVEIEKILEHHILSIGMALDANAPDQIFLPPEIDLDAFLEDTQSAADHPIGENGKAGEIESTTAADDQTLLQDVGAFERVYDMFSEMDESDAPSPDEAAAPSARNDRRTQPDFQAAASFQSLHRLIDDKSRAQFIKKIFKRDSATYDKFVEALEFAENWKTAKEILDEELSKREINPYSKEAVRLSDLVFSRYFPRR